MINKNIQNMYLLLVISSIIHCVFTFSIKEIGQDCRPPYGCFPTGPPWISEERPVCPSPLPLEDIAPQFCLHISKGTPCLRFQDSDQLAMLDMPIDSSNKLVFITHGYIESDETEWMNKMVDSFLDEIREEYDKEIRVITVSWAKGAFPPYAQAVANIRLVGAVTGHLVIQLMDIFGVGGYNIHLIGHSLGSHLMGYAGSCVFEHTGHNVGRITGLDPAGPYFRHSPEVVRLDPSDATFVDVIHTDSKDILPGISFSLGNPEPLGDLDFYPNGGGLQPGCTKTLSEEFTQEQDITKGIINYMNCNHQRSVDYFINSISSKACDHISVECQDWQSYRTGKCLDCQNNFCSPMGYRASNKLEKRHYTDRPTNNLFTGIKLFHAMDDWLPYCGTQMRITLTSSKSKEALVNGGDVAKFRLTTRGYDGQSLSLYLPPLNSETSSIYVSPGSSFTWVYSSFELKDIKYLVLEYLPPDDIIHFFIWRFSKPKVYLQNVAIQQLNSNSMKIFSVSPEQMEEGDAIRLLQSEVLH